jgi:hypothetical protein
MLKAELLTQLLGDPQDQSHLDRSPILLVVNHDDPLVLRSSVRPEPIIRKMGHTPSRRMIGAMPEEWRARLS